MVPLLLQRDAESILGPGGDVTLAPGDQLLLAGHPSARRYLLDTMTHHAVSEYVLTGRSVPSGWLWQRVTGRMPHSAGHLPAAEPRPAPSDRHR